MKSKFTQFKIHLQDHADTKLQNMADMTRFNTLSMQKTVLRIRVIVISLVLILFVGSFARVSGQSPYTSVASGNWNDEATWSGTGIPIAGDVVNIASGHAITVTAAAACTSITFPTDNASSSTLTINSGITLAVSGAITIHTAIDPSLNTVAVGAGILNAGSIAFSSSGGSTSQRMTISTGTVTVAGNLTAEGVPGGPSIIFSGAGLLRLGGTLYTSGEGTLTPGTGTVEYYASGAQTIVDFIYNNLTLSGSGAKTTTSVTVNAILTMEGTATASVAPTYGSAATLRYNTATGRTAGVEWITPFAATGGVIIANTGAITMDAAKVLNASVPLTVNSGSSLLMSTFLLTLNGNLVNNGNVSGTTGGVTISGGAAQNIGAFTTTGVVSMTKTGGTATLQGNVNGAGLTINGTGGAILNFGTTLTHTFSGNLTLTGGEMNGGSSTLRLGGSFSGTGATFTAGTGTVDWYATGAQTIPGGNYYNLMFSGSGAKTFSSAITVAGNFTMSGAATATPAVLLTVAGNTSLTGTSVLTLGAANVLSGALTLNGGTFSTGATTGNSETVGTLTLAGSSTISLGTGNHSLNFAASNAISWPGTTLTINGWTGTAGVSNTSGGKIFFGSSTGTLTGIQLAKISFTGYSGTPILLSSGELVPPAVATAPILELTGITEHGSSCVGIPATPIIYTITNSGGTASDISVYTSSPAQFLVSNLSSTTIAGSGGTATFTVTFIPTFSGARSAVIGVTSSTVGSNNPEITLTGTGTVATAGLTSSDPDNTICAGDAVTFTATGGTSYQFFVGGVSQGTASEVATFLTSTLTNGQIVTVTVTNPNGCFATSTGIATTVNPLPETAPITGDQALSIGSIATLGTPVSGGVWSSGTEAVATVNSNGEVLGISVGTSLIRYTVSNGTCTNFSTLLVTVSIASGIEDLQSTNGLVLKNHPNPFVGNTIVNYILPFDGRVTLSIRSLTGQVMKTLINEMELEGEYSLNLEAGDLQSGVYFATLRLKANGKELTKTIRMVKGK